MPNPVSISPVPLGAKAASGVGSSVDLLADGASSRVCVSLTLETLAIAGTTPSLTVSLETSPDGTSGWRSLGAFSSVAAPGRSAPELVLVGCDRYVRANWTLSALASATFSVVGQAHQLYAEPSDINLALPAKAVGSLNTSDLAASALAANVEAEGYLNGGYTLPLVSWDRDLKRNVAALMAFDAMKQRGFQPGGSDELIVKGRDDAVSWLTKISLGRIVPPGIVDSTPTVFDAGCGVATNPARGW